LLLHDALSDGIHEFTDEECLKLARSIRVVLIELAERISTALKEEAELKTAVSELLNRKPK
jgi:anti-sigma regulatory factor (Ser/Thr protein kinase)